MFKILVGCIFWVLTWFILQATVCNLAVTTSYMTEYIVELLVQCPMKIT